MAALTASIVNFALEKVECLVSCFGVPLTLPEVDEQAGLFVVSAIIGLVLARYRHAIFGRKRITISINVPPEANPEWKDGQVLNNPSLKDPSQPGRIQTYDKCTHRALGSGSVKAFTKADVDAAVGKARQAQQSWSKTTFEQRRQVLHALQDYITANQREICTVASRDTGKTMVDGGFGEVLVTCEKISWTLQHGEKALATEYRSTGMLMLHKTARVEFVPLGVLGAIIPWNYPFHNMFGQIISAIFAGNAIVIKVSEYASWSAIYFSDIVKATLTALGHDPEIIQIVTGFGDAGDALVRSGVDKLTFIGSPEVGKIVMRSAADNLTPVVLELGGKDAAIICEDCDFDQVCNLALRGTFQNCGQNCIGLERMVIHSGIYDRFVSTLTPKVQALTQGCPLQGDADCGAMTMGSVAAEKIEALVQKAVQQGAKCVAGGRVNRLEGSPGGFMQPTLLVDVTPEMDIAQHEVFGPVMVMMKAKDDEDALRIANSVEYGLGSSVFSKDYVRAERIASRMVTGMCNINDYGVNYLCQSLPFGGVNISGFDRFAGVEGLRGCCLTRSITSDKFPGVRTNIPPPLQYPVKEAGFQFCESLINLFYADGLWTKVKAAARLATL
eukprot:TRINITY_DN12733_c0_g1_i1.p1 TRINITY_DN12733_c0_g1~~TRINITY_DN12733_c0_g1_i1.p1  ORF type:complete len:614 (+),score=136.64 TRINITY_DN12733_c0_g1_i1:56-1897(+)